MYVVLMDYDTEDELTEEGLMNEENTNIGLALKKGALYKY